MKLLPELVPETAWCKNLRSALSESDWDRVRKSAYKKAGYKCEICGGNGKHHPVECHEVWEYQNSSGKRGIQRLKKVEAVCPACHEVKHIGLAQVRGRYNQAIRHMCRVNGISKKKAEAVVVSAMAEWQKRSQIEWDCDLTEIAGSLYNDGDRGKKRPVHGG